MPPDISEAQKQETNQAYQVALDDIKQELTKKRTEMAQLAKSTLEDYQAELPELEEELAEKDELLDDLNKRLKEKEDRLNRDEVSCKHRYDKLESKLRGEYENLKSELTVKVIAEDKRQEDYDHKLLQENQMIDKRKRDIQIDLENIDKDKKSIVEGKTDLENKKNNVDYEIREARKVLETDKTLIESFKEEARIKKEKASNLLKDIEKREVQAETIINKLCEIEGREKFIDEKEAMTKEQQERLNTDKVALLAETKKLNKRADDLNNFKYQLDTREENLKLLEAKIGE